MTSDIDANGLRARANVLRALRRWFDDRGYLEVPTAAWVPAPAMEEHLEAISVRPNGFLRTSPEFALKRALAAGMGRIYEIGPCFRAEEHGAWHSGEFTMCEWYRVGGELPDLMQDVKDLVAAAAMAIGVDVPASWPVVSMRQAFIDAAGVDPARASAGDFGTDDDGWDDALMRRWVADVEPSLPPTCFVVDWPASMAALARTRSDGEWPRAERFEAYLHGVELANAFLELNDAHEQRLRFVRANAMRAALERTPHPVDDALLDALPRLPRTSGIALGVDRLVAALSGWSGIAAGQVRHPQFG